MTTEELKSLIGVSLDHFNNNRERLIEALTAIAEEYAYRVAKKQLEVLNSRANTLKRHFPGTPESILDVLGIDELLEELE